MNATDPPGCAAELSPIAPSKEDGYGHSRLRVGEVLPAVCCIADVAALLGVSGARVYALQKAGELDVFELLPRIGNRPRYSGKKLQAWLDGEPLKEPAPTTRHYFGKSRR